VDGNGARPFWLTLPGILTGLAALITAMGGLIGTLYAAGVLGDGGDGPTQTPTPIVVALTPTPTATLAPTTQPTVIPTSTATFTPTITPEPPESPFSGLWTNVDPNTDDITRIEISPVEAQLSVHVWGACTPTECDWGAVQGTPSGSTLSVSWDQGFVLRTMTLTLTVDGELEVKTVSVYVDDRPRRETTELFRSR